MSIVALKRKSQRFIDPVSGQHGFSLNGGYRNQRAIGDTNLAQLKKSAELCYANDPAIIKRSTLNTKGYVFDHLRYPVCPPENNACSPQNNWTKNMSLENLTRSQGVYVDKVARSLGDCPAPVFKVVTKADVDNCTARKKYRIGGKLICQNMFAKNTGSGAVSSSDYQRTGLMKQNCLPTPAYAQAFPPVLTHDGCDGAIALTPAQAIALGQLPPNWTGIA